MKMEKSGKKDSSVCVKQRPASGQNIARIQKIVNMQEQFYFQEDIKITPRASVNIQEKKQT